jgi:DNA mismatch repair protein MutS
MERALQRISLNRAGPRDLALIGATLECYAELIAEIHNDISRAKGPPVPAVIRERFRPDGQESFVELTHLLDSAIVDDAPMDVSVGGFIKPGYDSRLDDLRKLRDQGQQFVHDLEDKYRVMTRCDSLKLRKTRHLGYFIEVTLKDSGKLMQYQHKRGEDDVHFIPAHSKKNASCFKTAELSNLESKFNNAAGEVQETEETLFEELCQGILAKTDDIKWAAQSIAALDVATANAMLARDMGLVRPTVDDSLAFNIKGGRHLTVEALHQDRAFVDNDCQMSDPVRLFLITGANMGGKSTYLRQNALIAIMAQMGAFVPAMETHIGLVDSVFSRVGASDDISHDKSTFMVEMTETAAILNRATERSLVRLFSPPFLVCIVVAHV